MRKALFTLALISWISYSYAQSGRFVSELFKVEKSDGQNLGSGGTTIDSLEGITEDTYEDDIIKITWTLGRQEFYFDLLNKSDQAIKIIWDEAAYVDKSGEMNKVFHNGIKYIDRNNPQVPTMIIKGAKVSDIMAPTDYVYFSSASYSSGWKQELLFSEKKKLISESDGKTVRLLLPISINNVTNQYVFHFKIAWEEKQKKSNS